MSSAAERNREPIWNVLKTYVTSNTEHILEISSGSGMHISYFAQKLLPSFPRLRWRPSEYDARCVPSIKNYTQSEGLCAVIEEPCIIDAADSRSWPNCPSDIILNINMIHITPFECSVGLFKLAGQALTPEGLLITYGPYSENGVLTPESNVRFNESLKSMNGSWGIRDVSELIELASDNGLVLHKTHEMPANNKILVWKKR
eukprot:TRINITY_DN7683_c0_g1_i1.p1 TRINITY_DN7683_c0_g1~~TRINITY_DN7683_c0_g1_i1.p1  ORF type:complete len:218 (+),score=26.70 TRINITY_DN7683_c0_g1_i1:50-655(+)